MLRCPQCRAPLEPARRCGCGFAANTADGILDLMTPEQNRTYGEFVSAFEAVRRAEGWGGEDLDLPYDPIGHQDIWAIRRRTFKRLDRLLQEECAPGGTALDVGAGNCWLTRHLDHWGFLATALDVNGGPQDGLRAGASYLTCGDKFERIRAPMEALPFTDESFDLVVTSGALHYALDLGRTLGELARVMKSAGVAVVLDSPWYERRNDGRRAAEQRATELTRTHGLDQALAGRSSFFYQESFDAATLENNLTYRRLSVWPGWRRGLEVLRGRFYERRVASFPLIAIRKRV